MRRVAAVVGAVVLIALGFAVRSRLDSGDRGTASAPAVLVCTSELADLCRDLDAAHDDLTVRVEDASTTQATLAAPEATADSVGFDGWLAPDAVAAMVPTEREAAALEPILGDPGPVLARTPTVMAVWGDRLAVLESHCGGTVTWDCVANVADQPWTEAGGETSWGDVKVGFPSIDTAEGLLTVAAATGSLLGTGDFASNDFGDLTFQERLGNLARSSGRSMSGGTRPIDELLTRGPAALQIAAAYEADAGPAVAAGARGDRVRVLYPAPEVTADLVLTPVQGAAGADRLDEILSSEDTLARLATAGWRVDGQPAAPGVDDGRPLPDNSNAPRPGVLIALRSTWTEVT